MNKGNKRDFKSLTLFVGGERCPVALFESFVERRPLLKHPCDGLFFSTPVANKTEKPKKANIVSSEHITNVTGHRGINFLNDYDEADEEELRYRLLQ